MGPIKSHAVPLIVLILICIYVSGFAWSWGPLGWLIPSEIYQLEVRTSGYFCAVAMNMVCTFVIGQFFLSALCRFRSGLFFFFAVMNVIMGLFAIFFLPETRGVPIEDMAEQRWKKHWHWKKYFKQNWFFPSILLLLGFSLDSWAGLFGSCWSFFKLFFLFPFAIYITCEASNFNQLKFWDLHIWLCIWLT